MAAETKHKNDFDKKVEGEEKIGLGPDAPRQGWDRCFPTGDFLAKVILPIGPS